MTWFEKIMPSRIKTERRSRSVPEGLWVKCPACDAVLYRAELERNLQVCPKCTHHMRIGARDRLVRFLDPESQQELAVDVEPEDPLKFRDSKKYRDRLTVAQKQTGERDALVVMAGRLEGLEVVACAFEFSFLGGSMGSVVGERFVRAAEFCIEQRRPLVCFSSSGGARMQEGLLSLMQMSKTSAVLARLAAARLPYISVLTDPTTGGVSASLAMLGDLNIAEPRALIGFAGPRVIEQTVRETLPEGFQRSEFLLEHGAIDCHRRPARPAVAHRHRVAAADAPGRAREARRASLTCRARLVSRASSSGSSGSRRRIPGRSTSGSTESRACSPAPDGPVPGSRSSRSAAPTARAPAWRCSKRCCARAAIASARSLRRTCATTASASASTASGCPTPRCSRPSSASPTALGGDSLTFFEFNTLAALLVFETAAPDVLLLEVGLGGRLDAVNVVDADVAVVVSVALDHMEYLGPDVESIGREKAGIFRAGRAAICGMPDPPQSLLETAAAVGARLSVPWS